VAAAAAAAPEVGLLAVAGLPIDGEQQELLVEAFRAAGQVRRLAEDELAALQRKSSKGSDDAVQGRGIVVADFRAEDMRSDEQQAGLVGQLHYLEASEGCPVDILIRDREGWAFCRPSDPPGSSRGWLPASYVVELATLIADHQVDLEVLPQPGVLVAKKGDSVEVASRHFSGWSFCREWPGVERFKLDDQVRDGWVTDSYLEDCSGTLDATAKFHRLSAEALAVVRDDALQLEALCVSVATRTSKLEWLPEDWTSRCLERASTLAGDLRRIRQAAAEREATKLEPGMVAVALQGVDPSGDLMLPLVKGDCVTVVSEGSTGWIWCRMSLGVTGGDKAPEGWVPVDAVEVLRPASTGTRPNTAASVPPSGGGVAPPLCSICFECLGAVAGRAVLPCAHSFHRQCVGPWLAEQARCPLCRTLAPEPEAMEDPLRPVTPFLSPTGSTAPAEQILASVLDGRQRWDLASPTCSKVASP